MIGIEGLPRCENRCFLQHLCELRRKVGEDLESSPVVVIRVKDMIKRRCIPCDIPID
jgi:hypothetical protein